MRIATWNLERTNPAKPAWQSIQDHLHSVKADVWILTETNSQLSLGAEFTDWHSKPIDDYHIDHERRTSIWTKLPVLRQIETHDAETCVCVELDSQDGPMLVFGTVIPYKGAGVGKLKYRSNCRWHTGQAVWAVHLESIKRHQKELLRLRAENAESQFIFAGDFNHHRFVGSDYGSEACDRLSRCLADANLRCVTEDDYRARGQLTTRSTVDHICLSPELVAGGIKDEAWEAPLRKGKPVCDHNGITVDIA